jgi:hypothetical protein
MLVRLCIISEVIKRVKVLTNGRFTTLIYVLLSGNLIDLIKGTKWLAIPDVFFEIGCLEIDSFTIER